MLRFCLFCLTLAVLPSFGEDRQQSTVLTTVPISLYTRFQEDPPTAVMTAVEDELSVIMDPIGLDFEWRSLAAARSNEVSVELAVITFKGRCDTAGLSTRSRSPGALGWTHISDGTILPFADIDCDRIREFMQHDLLYVDTAKREPVFGRAIARVLAHELFHIFANTVHHGSGGVAKSAYSVQELLSDDFHFAEGESIVLKRSPAHMHLENAGFAANGAPATPPI